MIDPPHPTTDPRAILEHLLGYRDPMVVDDADRDYRYLRACLRLARKLGRKRALRQAEKGEAE